MPHLAFVAREVFDLLFVGLVCGLLVWIEASRNMGDWVIGPGRTVLSGV